MIGELGVGLRMVKIEMLYEEAAAGNGLYTSDRTSRPFDVPRTLLPTVPKEMKYERRAPPPPLPDARYRTDSSCDCVRFGGLLEGKLSATPALFAVVGSATPQYSDGGDVALAGFGSGPHAWP